MYQQVLYNTAVTIYFELYEDDGVDLYTGASFAAGDIQISQDGAAFANPNTTTPTHEGGGVYSLPLLATEVDTLQTVVRIVDQTSTKAFLDRVIVLYTVGNASALLKESVQSITTSAITATSIATDAITGNKIADDAIDAATLADNCITVDQIATAAITADGIAANAITSSEIADNALTAAKLASNCITTDQVADNTITAAKVATGAIDADALGADCITAAKIADDALSNEHFATGALTATEASVNVTQISGDSVAADNLESQYDTTGLTGDTFPATQAAVGNLTSGTAAINTTAESFTKAGAEPETNTYTATVAEDGTYHIVEDDATSTDCYYQFDVTGNGRPVSITWVGYAQSNGDSYTIWAYNYGTTTYEQIGTINALNGTTPITRTYDLTIAHVGTGADLGKVRFRFLSSDGTAFATDRLLCSYSIVSQSVGYSNGAIWVDSAGTAGSEDYVNGTADNPCPWANALVISASLGIKKFRIANGNTVTLSASAANYEIEGNNWSLALGGQSIDSAFIRGATITGTGTGSSFRMECCKLANGAGMTVEDGDFIESAVAGDITFSNTGTGTYYFEGCYSGVAGTDTPSIDFGTASSVNTNVNFRHYSGGIEIINMGQSGTDKMSLEGWGQYILAATCLGGELAVRGSFTKTDNSRAVTISEDANYQSQIVAFGYAQSSTNNTVTLASTASATNGAYDPAKIFIVAGTGAGQSRMIYEYNGTTKVAVVDRNWKTNPDSTSEYRISANCGREHVNEGLAQAGAATTITLNALASASDDAYNGQMIFIRSGTGEDQVREILDYNGTTKVATVDTWAVNPDSTSGYAVLPFVSSPDISSLATASDLAVVDANVDSILVDTADMQPKLGTPVVSVSADIADVKSQTGDIETDTQDIQSRLPAALVGSRMDSNVGAINNSQDAALKLSSSANTIVRGTVDTVVNTHTPTTTEFQADDITEATADHYNGRVVIFTSGVLADQATDITDYVNVGGIGQFTVTAMTEAPSNNDTFVIV